MNAVRYSSISEAVSIRSISIFVQYFSVEFYSCLNFVVLPCGISGKLVNEKYTLGDLGVVPNGTIQLQLQSADPVNHPLQLTRTRQEYYMPDVITVRIHIGLFLFTAIYYFIIVFAISLGRMSVQCSGANDFVHPTAFSHTCSENHLRCQLTRARLNLCAI